LKLDVAQNQETLCTYKLSDETGTAIGSAKITGEAIKTGFEMPRKDVWV